MPAADIYEGKPVSYYKTFATCRQFPGTGNPKDQSDAGNDILISSAHTDAATWANKGYATTIAGTGKCLYIPNAVAAFDLAVDSIILSFNLNKAAPVSSEPFVACGDAGLVQGFYLSARSSIAGKIRPVFNTSGGVSSSLADSNAVFCDGTDRHLTFAVDGPSKSAYLFMDGILSNTYTNAFTGGTSITRALVLGGSATTDASIANVASYDAKFANIHFLKFAGSGLPANMPRLAQKLAANPNNYLTQVDLFS